MFVIAYDVQYVYSMNIPDISSVSLFNLSMNSPDDDLSISCTSSFRVSLATAKASYDKAIKSFRSHYAELSGCWDPNQSDAKKLKEAVDANLGADETAVDAPLVKTGTAIASLQTTIGQSMSALQTLINNNAGGGQ